MQQGPEADKIYVAHMLECIDRVLAYTESGQEVVSVRSSHLAAIPQI